MDSRDSHTGLPEAELLANLPEAILTAKAMGTESVMSQWSEVERTTFRQIINDLEQINQEIDKLEKGQAIPDDLANRGLAVLRRLDQVKQDIMNTGYSNMPGDPKLADEIADEIFRERFGEEEE